MIPVEELRRARETLDGIVVRTPLVPLTPSPGFEFRGVYAKLESLQVTRAFKIRGAYNKISNLLMRGGSERDAVARNGVVTFSSGNHAAGVAYAAGLLGVRSTIVMPEFSVQVKVEATRFYGGNVIIHGKTSVESAAKAVEIQEQVGSIFVHPFNDPYVIAGQGTVGQEILEDLPDIDTIVAPISGGGLISGIALAVKQVSPSVRVVGVQPMGAAAMYESVKRGELYEIESVDTVADGLTAKKVGDLTFSIVRKYVDDIVLVSEEEIGVAVRTLAFSNGILAEPSGAVAMAAVLTEQVQCGSGKTVVVVSGGNIVPSYLARLVTTDA